MGAVRQDRLLRAIVCALLVLVFAARIVAPSGFMPVRTSEGVMVTLCTGQGAVQVMVDRDRASPATGQHDSQHDDGQGSAMSEHCPFAGGASAPAIPTLPLLASVPVWMGVAGPIAFALKTGWIAALAAPPPPPQGPPAHLD
jgi:hypothetical protein